jgi:hypothetical protein
LRLLKISRPQPSAVIVVLARHAEIRLIKRQLTAQGLRPAHIARRIIVAAADEYFAERRQALIEEVPRLFGKFQNYEHSTIESNAIAGEIVDARCANYRELNTAANAERDLSAAGVFDGDGS